MRLLMAIIDQREAKAAQKAEAEALRLQQEQEARKAREDMLKVACEPIYDAWAGLPQGYRSIADVLRTTSAGRQTGKTQTTTMLKQYADLMKGYTGGTMTSTQYNEQTTGVKGISSLDEGFINAPYVPELKNVSVQYQAGEWGSKEYAKAYSSRIMDDIANCNVRGSFI